MFLSILLGLVLGFTFGACSDEWDDLPARLAERFRIACAACGWTLDRAARELGIAASTLTLKLQGEVRALTTLDVEKLSEVDPRFGDAWDERRARDRGRILFVLTPPMLKAALKDEGRVEVVA